MLVLSGFKISDPGCIDNIKYFEKVKVVKKNIQTSETSHEYDIQTSVGSHKKPF